MRDAEFPTVICDDNFPPKVITRNIEQTCLSLSQSVSLAVSAAYYNFDSTRHSVMKLPHAVVGGLRSSNFMEPLQQRVVSNWSKQRLLVVAWFLFIRRISGSFR